MPRVARKKLDYKKKDMYAFISGKMTVDKIRQKEIAEPLNVKQQTVSYRIRTGTLEYTDLLVIFDRLKLTDEEILKLMRL
jgi:predicted XRE-type DNA-binding protein